MFYSCLFFSLYSVVKRVMQYDAGYNINAFGNEPHGIRNPVRVGGIKVGGKGGRARCVFFSVITRNGQKLILKLPRQLSLRNFNRQLWLPVKLIWRI